MKSYNVKGLGYALAERHITSEELNTFVDTNDEWISSRTEIRAGYISKEENMSDLGARTARTTIDEFGTDPKEIDLVIVATFTPDQTVPSTVCLVWEKLGLNNQHMMAFNLNATCSGFLYALQSAHAMLAAEQVMCAPIIGAEAISKQLDWNDRSTCIIFADEAGAAIVKQEDTSKHMLRFIGSTGNTADVIHNDVPKPRSLFSEQPCQPSVIRTEGNATLRFTMKVAQEAIEDVSKQAGERIEDIDWIVPHQTDVRITDNICKCMHIDEGHVHINIEEYGNTSAASIPLVLGEMSKKGLLQSGTKIVLSGFGAGFTWAGCYIGL